MLSKHQRLSLAHLPASAPRRLQGALFSIKYWFRRGPGADQNRFGIVISKAVDRRSTKRHEIRRVVSTALGQWVNRGLDVVVILRPVTPAAKKADLVSQCALFEKQITDQPSSL